MYIGRYAPSPTGPLHMGSLVAAVASHLDARAHGGRWLLRIEDLDAQREVPGAAQGIIDTLQALGFRHDGAIEYQSRRHAQYQQALDRLVAMGRVYPCGCSRREIADSISRAGRQRDRELIYPGTCRGGLPDGKVARALRVRVDADVVIDWTDRSGRRFSERLVDEVGDFVLWRADGQWAYQLAVVVDDAAQGVTDIVRGEDLIGSTARQIFLQQLLGLPTPRYLHVPVVRTASGEKLSKQTGAAAVDANDAIGELTRALAHLGLAARPAGTLAGFWAQAIRAWSDPGVEEIYTRAPQT